MIKSILLLLVSFIGLGAWFFHFYYTLHHPAYAMQAVYTSLGLTIFSGFLVVVLFKDLVKQLKKMMLSAKEPTNKEP